jgi:branched-chain amino acid transport system permease protein
MLDDIISVLIFGTVDGAVYTLLAMGFSLVYGVGGILNLAHGGFYLLTGYLLYWTLSFTTLEIGIIIALVMISFIGGLSYLILIKPLQDTSMGVLLVTFAFAFFLEQLVKTIFGSIHLNIPDLITESITFLGITFSGQKVLILIVSLIVAAIIILFINKSKLGKSIRAVSQDRDAAELMGINANRILMYTLMISALLAGIASVLNFHYIAPAYGWSILTRSFAVVILGGMGSLLGSAIGSFVLGYITQFVIYFIDESWAFLIPFLVIFIMLVIRPRGIFGKKELD